MEDKVTAVIVTMNRKILLGECINSLLNQSRKVDELIIVDNNSTDGTSEFIKKKYLGVKKINYVHLNKNLGPSGGFYEGVKKAYEGGADWVWLMDDDSEPTKDCLLELMNAKKYLQKKKEKIGFLASCVYNKDGVIMNLTKISNKLASTGEQRYPQYLNEGIVQVDNATFVSVLFSRDFISKEGYPIKEMIIWGDDTEYSYRASKKYSCFLVGKSRATHKKMQGKVTTLFEEKNPSVIDRYWLFYRNNTYDLLKFESRYYSFLTLLNWLIVKPLRCLFYPPFRFKKARAIFWGTIKGFFFKPKIELP